MLNRKRRSMLLVLLVLAAAGCGGEVSETPEAPTPPVNPNLTSASVSRDTSGSLALPSGARVDIPSGAMVNEEVITLAQSGANPGGEAGALTLGGAFLDIDVQQETFEQAITITIPYDEAQLPGNRTEEEIFAAFLFEGTWYPMYGIVDDIANTVTVESVHASVWTWAVVNQDNVADAMARRFGFPEPADIPMTRDEAVAQVEQRRDAFFRALNALELKQAEFEDELGFGTVDEIAKFSILLTAEQFLKEAAAKAAGKKLILLQKSGTTIGYLHLITGAVRLFEVSFDSGDLLAEMLRVELAHLSLLEAEAILWVIDHPHALTMPPEYAEALGSSVDLVDLQEAAERIEASDTQNAATGDDQSETDPPPQPDPERTDGLECYPLDSASVQAYFSERCPLPGTAGARSVFAADLNNDGAQDLLLAAGESLLWLDASAGYAAIAIAEELSLPQSAVAADLDQDGDLDVIGAGYWGVAWWANDGSGGFSGRNDLITERIEGRTATAADLDGDGMVDILIAEWETDSVILFRNRGSGSFEAQLLDDQFPGANRVEAIDIDQDGDLDILGAAGYSSSGRIVWWENSGGVFAKNEVSTLSAFHANAADLDGDGLLDIVGVSPYSDDVVWYPGLGSAFGEGVPFLDADGEDIRAFYALSGDVDEDGADDLLVSGYCDIYLWTSSTGLNTPLELLGCSARPGVQILLDFDQDGDLDLIIANRGDGGALWLRR